MFRGFGNGTDAAMGFALWERDHWVPTRVVEACLEVAYRALEDAFDEASRRTLRSSVDAAKGHGLADVRERAQRSERLSACPTSLQHDGCTVQSVLSSVRPVGFSHDAVRCRVVLDPSLDPHEISTSWLQVLSAPSSPDKSASGVSLLPTGPGHRSLHGPTSDDQLRLLVKVATAASDIVTEI
ncbi:unnamed protein product [Phytophthora fragariaefolia]|uniref:Unnamed protein product n=1 Tax=Phytophthora fragariaefolia TaxID=1490495 RepID=A0A9W6UCL2_9STRA|nr:unnamed protein product [Phytophthora fragariaefolia]